MIRLIISCMLVLNILGCSHVVKIPAPESDWPYIKSANSDAELQLNLTVHVGNSGGIWEPSIYFRKKPADPRFRGFLGDLGESIFLDGPNSSGATHISIKDITETNVLIKIYWRDTGAKTIDSVISIPYLKSGKGTVNDSRYSWKWIILDPNQRVEPTAATPVNPVSTNRADTAHP